MKLTLQAQLRPDASQSVRLRTTVERFNEAATWVAGVAFERQITNKITLQHVTYREVRDRFRLSAQSTILCIHRACEAYKRDKSKQPKFRKHAAITYDPRIMHFKKPSQVSLLTLTGRVIVPLIMGKYQADRFTNQICQADLILRKDGRWFLSITINVPDGAPIPTMDFIGVDLGIVNLAVDSDGNTYSGATVENVRQRHQRNRQRLQKRGTKGAKKRLKALAGKEGRFRRHTNHVISKAIVATAKDTGRGIALEDLSGIRNRITVKSGQRARHASWAFSQMRTFIDYKARLSGIPIVLIDPRNTSRTCHECQHCEKSNRKSQAEFVCKACGHQAPADQNAARNIRAKALLIGPDNWRVTQVI